MGKLLINFFPDTQPVYQSDISVDLFCQLIDTLQSCPLFLFPLFLRVDVRSSASYIGRDVYFVFFFQEKS